ncbi:exopolysaccharide biosynthesis protein [Pseudomonas lopnurensis]|uniref:exopolysaccharide biosynthesis protein n=1 Tax=Pseudomonas lopnurensis TaxID=1477517 RepID=UPI00187AC15B|nr:exopolysaccharide biosynthesis protein [Pseudomonas lopnurensis]MBE7376689.1 exopolysaccharide biosynthesis protein [Pseudomonas lopnurensis]
MSSDEQPQNLESLLQRLEQAGEPDQPVTIECMLQVTDERSFGALLLIPGLLVLSPLSGIPGLPSVIAVMVMLIAVQLLIGRERFWLPQWLLRRSASRSKYDKAIAFLQRLSGFVDRLLRRRLTFLTSGLATRLNALLCMLIAATMPPLELIPFGNSIAGAALSVLGLGMMARDGAMIVVAALFFFGLVYMTSRLWL